MQKKFIFLDLEMSGLDPENDVILEIAAIATNAKFEQIGNPLELVIYQPESALKNMPEVVRKMHTTSGLLTRVAQSRIDLATAKSQLLAFLDTVGVSNKNTHLAGNSIWMDRAFIARYMPEALDKMNYRLLDVSALKLVVNSIYGQRAEFKKSKKHRALQDIEESISELRYYLKQYFILPNR